jgi:hypothetical protein
LISASGLPGSLVACIRAGMTMSALAMLFALVVRVVLVDWR